MNKKGLRQNLIFAAVVLVLAGALFGFRAWKNAQNKADGLAVCAELTYGTNGSQTKLLSLDEDGSYDIDTGTYVVHIEVKDGAARFVDSPCPDHLCESFGWISMEDQTAVCMPAQTMLMIVPKTQK